MHISLRNKWNSLFGGMRVVRMNVLGSIPEEAVRNVDGAVLGMRSIRGSYYVVYGIGH